MNLNGLGEENFNANCLVWLQKIDILSEDLNKSSNASEYIYVVLRLNEFCKPNGFAFHLPESFSVGIT